MLRLKAVMKKEFIHIKRDPRSLVIILILPLIMIFIFGHVLSFDLKKIETLIIDLDHSELSQQLATRFAASPLYSIYFFSQPDISKGKITNTLEKLNEENEKNIGLKKEGQDREIDKREKVKKGIKKIKLMGQQELKHEGEDKNYGDYLALAEKWLRQGKIKQYMIIPPNFSQNFSSPKPSEVVVIIDGSDANVANRIYQYNERIFYNFFARVHQLGPLFSPQIKMSFNPEISSTPFILPGLVAALMLMISAMLTSLSLTREKETGSIDLLFISPLRTREIILGKTIPYLMVALLVSLMIFLFAHVFFSFQIKGSLFLLFLASFVYLAVGLSFGLLISTAASTQKVAMLVTLLGTILPSIFLSGFIFPLESLSPILRSFSYLVPATYFLRILRGIALKGASLHHFLFDGLILLFMSFFLLIVASRKFQSLRRAKA